MPGEHGAGCQCQDEPQLLGGGQQHWLNPVIHHEQACAMNNETPEEDVGKLLNKTFDERIAKDEILLQTPEGDNEMIVHIPFTTPCQLTSVFCITGDGDHNFKKMNMYANPPLGFAFDFWTWEEMAPTQKVELAQGDLCGVVEYPVKVLKFQNLMHLVLHFPWDEDTESEKQLFWVGLKGISSGYKRKAVVTVYESQANLADHPAPEEENMGNMTMK